MRDPLKNLLELVCVFLDVLKTCRGFLELSLVLKTLRMQLLELAFVLRNCVCSQDFFGVLECSLRLLFSHSTKQHE